MGTINQQEKLKNIVKYNHLLYKYNEKWYNQKVSSVFWLACFDDRFIPDSPSQCGINIGIAIPHKNQEECDKFYHNFHQFATENYFYLLGGNGIKIPLVYSCANSLNVLMGTSCVFAYINPFVLGPDERPEYKYENNEYGVKMVYPPENKE